MLHKGRMLILGLMFLIPLMVLSLIVFLLSSIRAEYIVVAPLSTYGSEKLSERINQFTQRLDTYGQSADLTICSKKQGEMIFSPYDEAEATVYGIQENYCDFRFLRIQSGRCIDCTDVSQAKQVAVIDEAAALALFHGQEAIGQKVSINGASYEIVGTCSYRNALGEKDQHLIFIPISTVEMAKMEMETMECLLRSEAMALSDTMIQSAVSEWDSNAQLFTIQQEVWRMFLPMALAGIIFAGFLMINFCRMLMRKICVANARTHDILRHHYVRKSIASIILRYIPVIVGCLFVVFGFYGLIQICLFILRIFSSSLPERLLSIAGWRSQLISFWKEGAQCIQVRCYELEMIRIIGNIAQGVYIILTAIFFGMIALERNQKHHALSA